MEEFFTTIKNALRPLSERERTAMRQQLAVFVSEHPARTPLLQVLRARLMLFFAARRRHGYGLLAGALSLVLIVGVGTSYAAETALPGNFLYTVKVAVDEPLERATVASGESATQWDLTLANRRLEEAEKLAASGSLDPASASLVQSQIAIATHDFNESVAAAATSTADATLVADAQSQFEASLAVHADVLSTIASSSPALASQVAPIIATVRSHVATAHAARLAAIKSIDSGAASPLLKVAATDEMQAAVSGLAVIRTLPASALSPQTAGPLDFAADASTSAASIAAGNTSLAAGNFKAAFTAFQSAVVSATEAQVGAQAQSALGTAIVFPPLASVTATTSTSTDPIRSVDATTTTPSTASSTAGD